MFILEHAKTFCTEGGARKEQESVRKWIGGMWGFLAYRSAGVRLGLQCLLAVSAEENMRCHLFSKIRACSAALRAAHSPFPSLCTVRPHLGRQMSLRVPFVPAADKPAPVPEPRGYISTAQSPSQEAHFSAGPSAYQLRPWHPSRGFWTKLADVWPAQQTGGADRGESAPSRHRHFPRQVCACWFVFHYAVTHSFPSNNV